MRPATFRLCLYALMACTVLAFLALPLADAVTMAAYVYGEAQP